ncbi:uncharacterized protein N7506_006571 [Penicillium brevicompactum]|uniref:uncharacterized protein n=1 Tax=Penicillium brevicompactum TaxID=5074 RepID=UPI0025402326|nr:uncharacterized protein N7506_006571 [Penicillium brevicompactum]KAJ5332788.1 hypothetical protein N7506_006571 [Penicillium brevicompactum]
MEPASEFTQTLSEWVLSRSDHSTQDPNIGFVETLYHTCSTALVYLWRSRFRFTSQIPRKNTLKKDVADIRLWEENFPPGHLDAILEQSRHLKTNVIENLKGIGSILRLFLTDCNSAAISGDQRDVESSLAMDLDAQLEKTMIMLSSDENSESSSDDEFSDDSSSSSERETNQFGRIHCYVSCLMDTAPLINKRIAFSQGRVESQQTSSENVMRFSQSAQPFAMRIQDRFCIGLTPLVERLAQANWERSIRIRAQREEQSYVVDRDTVTLFKPCSIFNDSGIGTSAPTMSQYAASAASHTSYLSTPGIEAHGRPRVPSLPQSDGRPFQCDYCRKVISLQTRIDWKMHVFADLQSYLCTHADCEDALVTFPTRKLWADHEFNEHFTQKQWRCFVCNTLTTTENSFVEHYSVSHNIQMPGSRLAAAISEAQEAVLGPEFREYKCVLCSQRGWQTRKAYATHVGQHLEEISLASLPRDEKDSSDADSESDISNDATKRSLPGVEVRPTVCREDPPAITPILAGSREGYAYEVGEDPWLPKESRPDSDDFVRLRPSWPPHSGLTEDLVNKNMDLIKDPSVQSQGAVFQGTQPSSMDSQNSSGSEESRSLGILTMHHQIS